ncbi:MAG TPA: HEAT repeat domain-containing protein, partial [Planctomycetota bacterium]|nr:HEAT repeat domain-containing protein [Planctomycetota bacterium]
MTLLLALLLLAPQEDARALIEKLRTGTVEERDAATHRLMGLGEGARAELDKAAQDPNAEFAGVAKRLLFRLELIRTLPARLQEHQPGIADRLAFGQDPAWTTEFQEAESKRTKSGALPLLTRAEIEPLAARAVRGASNPEDKYDLTDRLANRLIRSVDVELARYFDDPTEEVRDGALWALSRSPPASVLNRIRDLAAHENAAVRVSALQVAGPFRIYDALPNVVRCLEDKNDAVRAAALPALAELKGKGARELLARALDDRSAEVRQSAVESLQKIRATEEGPRIAKRVAD